MEQSVEPKKAPEQIRGSYMTNGAVDRTLASQIAIGLTDRIVPIQRSAQFRDGVWNLNEWLSRSPANRRSIRIATVVRLAAGRGSSVGDQAWVLGDRANRHADFLVSSLYTTSVKLANPGPPRPPRPAAGGGSPTATLISSRDLP